MVIFGMSSASSVMLVSRSPYFCLNFYNQPFDAENVANSSLFNFSFINIAFSFNMGLSGNTFALAHFLYQVMRILLIKWLLSKLNEIYESEIQPPEVFYI